MSSSLTIARSETVSEETTTCATIPSVAPVTTARAPDNCMMINIRRRNGAAGPDRYTAIAPGKRAGSGMNPGKMGDSSVARM